MHDKKNYAFTPVKSLADTIPIFNMNIFLQISFIYAWNKRNFNQVLSKGLVTLTHNLGTRGAIPVIRNRLSNIGISNYPVPPVK
jgi:hypothetical protein